MTTQITNCSECPNFSSRRVYGADSWEISHDWFCKAENGRKIQGFVEWHEESKVLIPNWCPLRTNPIVIGIHPDK